MPTDLATYVAALDETWTSLTSVCAGLTDDQWDLPTDLPGWSVKDNVSHIVGVELYLLGEPYPSHDPGPRPWIRNEAGAWMEVAVDVRRGVPGPAVLAELRDVTKRRLSELRALSDADLDTEVPSVMGFTSVLRHLLAIRVFDSWAHEQDVRRALGRPGGCDGVAAMLSLRRLLLALSRSVRGTVVVALDSPAAVATLREGSSYLDGEADGADARIATSFETFLRLGTGRCAYADRSDVTVTGDVALAEELLRDMAVTP